MWGLIEHQLKLVINGKDSTINMYYIGGSLCMSFVNISTLCLTLDGNISLFETGWRGIQPEYINKLVQKVYLIVKGDTVHLVENSFKSMLRYDENDYFLSFKEETGYIVV